MTTMQLNVRIANLNQQIERMKRERGMSLSSEVQVKYLGLLTERRELEARVANEDAFEEWQDAVDKLTQQPFEHEDGCARARFDNGESAEDYATWMVWGEDPMGAWHGRNE